MLKKVLFMIVALLGMTTIAANAQTKVYNGCLDDVYMNEPKDPIHNTYTTVTSDGTNITSLQLEQFQVGSMPGNITVQVSNISVDGEGNFEVTQDGAIILTIGRLQFPFTGKIYGNITGDTLEYTVESIDASYMGFDFEARVHFTTACE